MLRKDVALKNNTPFRSCISKISNKLIDNTVDHGIVMAMYILLEYSDNYFMTSGSLWNYYRDKTDDVDDDAWEDKSFKYKIKIIEKTEVWPPVTPLNTKVNIPHKCLSNFWRSLDIFLINCEVEIYL